MRLLKLLISFLFAGVLFAQEPIFVFTPDHHGKVLRGYFRPRGSISFMDQYDGTVEMIEIPKIYEAVFTARKAPFDTKCGSAPRVVLTLTDGSKRHGCFGPASLSFVGDTATIPTVNSMLGKVVREKPQ